MAMQGSFSIARQGQCLILSFSGNWTNFTSRQMCEAYFQQALPISLQPWGTLIDTSSWFMGDADIWIPITKILQWSEINHQRHLALVTTERLQQIMFKRTLSPFRQIRTEFFDDRNKAVEWLQKEYPILKIDTG